MQSYLPGMRNEKFHREVLDACTRSACLRQDHVVSTHQRLLRTVAQKKARQREECRMCQRWGVAPSIILTGLKPCASGGDYRCCVTVIATKAGDR